MTSTVPGIRSAATLAQALAGARAPDVTGLAAATVQLPGSSAIGSGALSPAIGGGFTAALKRALAARRAANGEQAAALRASAARRPAPERAEDVSGVRDVVRQLKSLVNSTRETGATNARYSPSDQRSRATSAAALDRPASLRHDQGPDLTGGDVHALRGALTALAGRAADGDGGSTAQSGASSAQDAEAQALVHAVADVLAGAIGEDGEINDAALASALATDPNALAAAQSFLATLHVVLLSDATASLSAGDGSTGEGAGGSLTLAANSDGTTANATLAGRNQDAGPLRAGDVGGQATIDARASGVASGTDSSSIGADVAAGNGAQANVLTASSADLTVETAAPAGAGAASGGAGASAEATAAAGASSAGIQAIVEMVGDSGQAGDASAARPTASLSGSNGSTDDAAVPGAALSGSATMTGAATAGDNPALQASAVSSAAVQAGEQVEVSVGGGTAGAIENNLAAAQAGAGGGSRDMGSSDGDTSGQQSSGSQTASGVSSTAGSPGAQGAQGAQGTATAGAGAASLSITDGAGAVSAGASRVESVPVSQESESGAPVTDLHDQVAPVIVRQARLVNIGGSQELSLRLTPDHLGPLSIRISLEEGALTIGLTAATSESQRALESALPQLRGALVEAGLRPDRLDVSLRDSGNGGQSGQRDAAGSGGGRGRDGQPSLSGGNGGTGTGSQNGDRGENGPSFTDVLIDQDGRAFGLGSRDAALSQAGYRAYGALRTLLDARAGGRR